MIGMNTWQIILIGYSSGFGTALGTELIRYLVSIFKEIKHNQFNLKLWHESGHCLRAKTEYTHEDPSISSPNFWNGPQTKQDEEPIYQNRALPMENTCHLLELNNASWH